MSLFIKKIFIFIISFVVLILLQFIAFKLIVNYNTDYKLENDTTILILGDSHIEAALNDSIIDNSVNFSSGGSPVFFNYVKLKKIVESNEQISTIILGYSPINLTGKGFYEVPKMKSMLINYYYLIDYSDYLDIAKYNFKGLVSGITGVFRSVGDINFRTKINVKNVGIGGFRKLPTNTTELLEKDIKDKKLRTGKSDFVSTKYFFKIIEFCQANGIRLVILNTPIHESLIRKSTQRRMEYNSFMNNLNADFTFWDYEDLHFEDTYFFDENHLNYKGAEIFSKIINDRLSERHKLIYY